MATHTIKMRDWRHDEPRTIVWNDETGEVSGDHVWVQGIRDMIERAEGAGGVLTHYGFWRLADPRRDPACFVAVLYLILGRDFDEDALPEPLRSADTGALLERAVLPEGAVA